MQGEGGRGGGPWRHCFGMGPGTFLGEPPWSCFMPLRVAHHVSVGNKVSVLVRAACVSALCVCIRTGYKPTRDGSFMRHVHLTDTDLTFAQLQRICWMRLDWHALAITTGRFTRTPRGERVCKLCSSAGHANAFGELHQLGMSTTYTTYIRVEYIYVYIRRIWAQAVVHIRV
jgi:hypothetical protein